MSDAPELAERDTGPLPADVSALHNLALLCAGKLFVLGKGLEPAPHQTFDPPREQMIEELLKNLADSSRTGKALAQRLAGELTSTRTKSQPFHHPCSGKATAHQAVFDLATKAVVNGHRKKLTLEHALSLDEYETFGRELTWEAAALRDNRSLTLRQPKGDDVAHSEDFRSMRWGEELFSFTANQAPAVKMLFENWQRGTPDVGNETLCEAIDQPAPPKRLDILFRGHPAWGTLIVSGGTKGTHRMSDPQKKS